MERQATLRKVDAGKVYTGAGLGEKVRTPHGLGQAARDFPDRNFIVYHSAFPAFARGAGRRVARGTGVKVVERKTTQRLGGFPHPPQYASTAPSRSSSLNGLPMKPAQPAARPRTLLKKPSRPDSITTGTPAVPAPSRSRLHTW
jgi:hypothetical protein